MFEDDETLQMYIEESLEHLGDIENDLLTIEEAGEDIDVDLVNNVFRAAHSIKGGAGFMGLTTVKDLAHHLENVLGLVRTREMIPDSHKISVLLNGFDKLETLLRNVEQSNEVDITDHINTLEGLINPSEAVEEPPREDISQTAGSKRADIVLKDGRKFANISSSKIEKCKNEGKNLFLVEYDLIKASEEKGIPTEISENLAKTGSIIESRIASETDEKIQFQILFASIIENDMTETLFRVDKKFIHEISNDMVVSTTITDVNAKPAAMPPLEEQTDASVKDAKPEAAAVQQTQQKTAPAAKAKKTPAKKEAVPTTQPQSSLRVNVGLLDTLMNLAGELVLSRNQLLQGINSSNAKTSELSSQRIDMITSELQEAIMRTRMQPIGNILNKFSRVVRDLSQQLGKNIDLFIEGKEVELDKTILEAINDPLTHLVRNSVDHGIELPEVREQMGKKATGKIELKAYHDAGQVTIVITDDGKGLDPDKLAVSAVEKGLLSAQQVDGMTTKQKTELIMMPGFSTAKEVTDVSGRGVGMDVVTTNIETLGGIIDLDSNPGEGTTIKIKLPLTLAIIPSQITSAGNERYAVPQVNLNELLRVPAGQVKDKIEKVGHADVVRLRGELLPLLNLSKMLGIEKSYNAPDEDKAYSDRRENIADRRSKKHIFNAEGLFVETSGSEEKLQGRPVKDRRYHAQSALNIAVVSAGAFKYGLIIDQLHDAEEIVVKPVGRHLNNCKAYAGATIMGDGKVALILDISNLAQMAELSAVSEAGKTVKEAEKAAEAAKDRASLLTFKNGENEHFAAPLNIVERIERIQTSTIEMLGDRKIVQYRGGALPIYELSQVADFQKLPEKEQQEVIVFKIKQRELGLMVTPPVDVLEVTLDVDEKTLKQPSISGSMTINNHTTLLVDIFEMVKILIPDWFKEEEKAAKQMADSGKKTLLFAEDSAFFRSQIKTYMEENGFTVLEAEDGLIAWELLKERSDDIDLIVTDLEMPNMDGFELTQKVKANPQYSHLSVIALTSLTSKAHIDKGEKSGIDEYKIKFDREKLMKVIRKHLNLSE